MSQSDWEHISDHLQGLGSIWRKKFFWLFSMSSCWCQALFCFCIIQWTLKVSCAYCIHYARHTRCHSEVEWMFYRKWCAMVVKRSFGHKMDSSWHSSTIDHSLVSERHRSCQVPTLIPAVQWFLTRPQPLWSRIFISILLQTDFYMYMFRHNENLSRKKIELIFEWGSFEIYMLLFPIDWFAK